MDLLSLLATPDSQKVSITTQQGDTLVAENQQSFPVVQGIPVLLENPNTQNNNYYEQFYQSQAEPWAYSERAAEVLRHEYVAEQVQKIYKENGKKLIILDLGCSLGHITERLHPFGEVVIGLDISLTAVLAAQKRCVEVVRGGNNPYQFVVGSTLALPFKENSFDVVVASDGVGGWFEEGDKLNYSKQAVAEIYRVLKKGGIVIHTDYMNPRYFDDFVKIAMSAPFQKISEEPLYDRLWYRAESWLKAFSKQAWVKKLLADLDFARRLRSIAQKLGRNYSKHISLIAKK